jgi:hypothetical protein
MPNDIIDAIESDVTALAERDDLTADEVFLLREKLSGVIKRAKDALATVDTFIVGWLPTQPDPRFFIADTEYFVAPKKKIKCRSISAAVKAIFEAAGGDEQAFCDTLSANAIKYGEARKLLGDDFEKYFETQIEMGLDHKPVKELKSINTRFLK